MKRFKKIIYYLLLASLSFFNYLGLLPTKAYAGQNGTTLMSEKTATGHWQQVYRWDIEKSVSPSEWQLLVGDSATSAYTIDLIKSAPVDTYSVTGSVCVTNGGAVDTENLTIVDVVQTKTGAGQYNDYLATNLDLSGKPVLGPGESYCYAYDIDFTPVPGATYRNVARITITNHSGQLGEAFGPEPKADFAIPSTPTTVNDEVTVEDVAGGISQKFNTSSMIKYDKEFSCAATGETTYPNTATILETGQSSEASVAIKCYDLEMAKTATTSFDRAYSWMIAKSASAQNLILSLGQYLPVNYQVVVDASYADKNFAAAGLITLANNTPIPATINSIKDVISGDIAAGVTSPVTLPYEMASGETLQFTYSAALPDASSRSNAATAAIQNYHFTADMQKHALSARDLVATAAVDFASATITEIDKTVDVTDSIIGALGTVTYGVDSLPKTFAYTLDLGGYENCGPKVFDNTASFLTSDTNTTGSATWRVDVNVPCLGGCSLTQGYWKTHSEFGPAKYDDAWNLLPAGANTTFFLSGKSWYQAFWTAPKGDPYYTLAHQYMAAKLNVLNGADPSTINTTLTTAENLLKVYLPGTTLSKTLKTQFTTLASTLDKYNNGLIGPGHCSE